MQSTGPVQPADTLQSSNYAEFNDQTLGAPAPSTEDTQGRHSFDVVYIPVKYDEGYNYGYGQNYDHKGYGYDNYDSKKKDKKYQYYIKQ